ncbi:MAG: DUF2784 domain-containing protein [Pirellulaceae bacterium]
MNTYTILADIVVLLHLAYVLYVLLGQVAIMAGYRFRWSWTRSPWFRISHVSMIGIVVVEALLSITCPLTTLETYLRLEGGQTVRDGSFIGRLAHDALFVSLDSATLTFLYCAFGFTVLVFLILSPIRWASHTSDID